MYTSLFYGYIWNRIMDSNLMGLIRVKEMTSFATQMLFVNPFYSSLRSTRIDNGLRGDLISAPGHNQKSLSARCSSFVNDAESVVARRSANYTSCAWDYDYIQSNTQTHFLGDEFKMQIEEMKQQVLVMLGSILDQAEQLELINDLQRLGVAYHFENEIKTILDRIYYRHYVFNENSADADLNTTALAFRLFRQHGFAVPQDVFNCFLEASGKFKSSLCSDIKGLISLYEASYLATEGEVIMEEAWTFTTANLSKVDCADVYLDVLSARALDMPLHWRDARSEARWFIDKAYSQKPNMSPLLLLFAKLDFNIVQAMYLEELRELARWWRNLGFDKDLNFARDCLVVSYLWGLMASPDPQYPSCRKAFTEIIAVVSTVDDVYDIYGTLEEVELLTDAFKRWDIDAMKQLPHYMKKCYLACYNSVNGMAYDVLKEKGSDVSSYLKKAILSSVYMTEARWFHSGYKPTMDEYMSNAWLSVSIPLCFMHGHIFDTKPVGGKQLQYLESFPDIMKWSCIIVRLSDDLGTSPAEMARGDVPKAIQCYMNDTGASEQAAREHVEALVREGWKKLNRCVMEERTLTSAGVERLLNLVRAGHCFYQHGDGHGVQDGETKHLMSQVLFDPIPL